MLILDLAYVWDKRTNVIKNPNIHPTKYDRHSGLRRCQQTGSVGSCAGFMSSCRRRCLVFLFAVSGCFGARDDCVFVFSCVQGFLYLLSSTSVSWIQMCTIPPSSLCRRRRRRPQTHNSAGTRSIYVQHSHKHCTLARIARARAHDRIFNSASKRLLRAVHSGSARSRLNVRARVIYTFSWARARRAGWRACRRAPSGKRLMYNIHKILFGCAALATRVCVCARACALALALVYVHV